MIKLSNGIYIIGFDNGYQFGKTAGTLFDNGVHPLGKVEPSIKEHSLKYGRKYYKVGEGRAAITEDKVSDENARLLTMVAIAKELKAEGVQNAEIILAVGLPFSDYGREKKDLVEYYNRIPVMKYEYEGIRYHITIRQVLVYPQCYSAIASRLCNMAGDYNLFILPSSIHECLVLPDNGEFFLENLEEMVAAVNQESVSPEEFLSDHVYYYNADSDRLLIAGADALPEKEGGNE